MRRYPTANFSKLTLTHTRSRCQSRYELVRVVWRDSVADTDDAPRSRETSCTSALARLSSFFWSSCSCCCSDSRPRTAVSHGVASADRSPRAADLARMGTARPVSLPRM